MTPREGTADQLYIDNPHVIGHPLPTNWRLWEAYFERIGPGRERTTNPCNCMFCSMSEADVDEYRRRIRRMHGERA